MNQNELLCCCDGGSTAFGSTDELLTGGMSYGAKNRCAEKRHPAIRATTAGHREDKYLYPAHGSTSPAGFAIIGAVSQRRQRGWVAVGVRKSSPIISASAGARTASARAFLWFPAKKVNFFAPRLSASPGASSKKPCAVVDVGRQPVNKSAAATSRALVPASEGGPRKRVTGREPDGRLHDAGHAGRD